MPFPHIPDQDHYLYTVKWNQPRDEHLISRLLASRNELGEPKLPHKNHHILVDVMEKVNEDLGTKFHLLDLTQRLDFLEARFKCFKDLMMLPETQWDRETNRIMALDEVWEKIFEEKWLAQAYLRAGEPEFPAMCMLFAPNDIKCELSHTLVLISDSPQPKKIVTINLSDSSPDTEVNSPAPPPPKRVVRKLRYDADDAHSGVALPSTTIPRAEPAENDAQVNSVKTARMKAADKCRPPCESSCASSSPL